MLDGSEFFECECGTAEHTVRFIKCKDKDDPAIFVSMYLNSENNLFQRIYVALRYIVGCSPKYGHFGECIIRQDDFKRARIMFEEMEAFNNNVQQR